jgi:hypothetical protein
VNQEFNAKAFAEAIVKAAAEMGATLDRMQVAMDEMAAALSKLAATFSTGPSTIVGVCAVKDYGAE